MNFQNVPDVPYNRPEPTMPLTLLLPEFSSQQEVACPCCGFQNVHHCDETLVIDSKDNYQAHPLVRGNLIVVPCWCEQGCKFNIVFGFHKGFLKVWTEKRTGTLPSDYGSSQKS